jgi:hypothetical protein
MELTIMNGGKVMKGDKSKGKKRQKGKKKNRGLLRPWQSLESYLRISSESGSQIHTRRVIRVTQDHGLAGSADSDVSFVIASQGKMADPMGFSVM